MGPAFFGKMIFARQLWCIVIAGLTLANPEGAFTQSAPKIQPPPANKAPQGLDQKSASEAGQLVQQAIALIEKEQSKAAIPLLRKALALSREDSQAHHYLGYALWKEGQPEASAVEFRRALRLDATNVYAKYFLARLGESKGQLAESAQLYEAVIAAGQPVYDTYSQLSHIYLRLGQKTKALQSLEQAVQQYPLDGALHYRLGQIYKQEGKPKEAARAFETAARLKQTDQSSIQKTLDLSVALQNKQVEQVLKLRGELLQQASEDPEILIRTGVLLGEGGYYRESIEPLQLAAKLLPASFEAYSNLGLSLARLEETTQAEAALRRALELQPNSFEANTALAVLYVKQARIENAIKHLRAARQSRPDNVKVLALLGQQYLQGHYAEQAAETLQKAVQLKADDARLRQLLVSAYQSNKEFDKALTVAQESLRLFPSIPQAHLDVGEQLANLGRYQEARTYYDAAIRTDASFTEAYNLLGDSLLKNGEHQAALEKFQAARSLDARNLRAARGIGRSLNRLQRYSEAVAELEKSIRIFSGDAQLFFELAQAYTRLGNQEKASEHVAAFEKLRSREIETEHAARPRQYRVEAMDSERK
jgi:tetratricopeptide (TPR) repeat protein